MFDGSAHWLLYEDIEANPEDPTLGFIHLNIPKGNGVFNGELFFTYVGCQSRNIGSVIGTRSNQSLNGN